MNEQETREDIFRKPPNKRKYLGSVEKNDIWREGYNHCLEDVKKVIFPLKTLVINEDNINNNQWTDIVVESLDTNTITVLEK